MVARHDIGGASRFGDGLSNSSAPTAYPLGRQCQEEGCGVLLSRYNSTDWCARHESSFSIQKSSWH